MTNNQLAVPGQQQAIQRSAGIEIHSLDDMLTFSKIVCDSGLAPKSMTTQPQVIIALQLGLELGLSPMQAIQNVAVINGKPSIYGAATMAIVQNSGLMQEFDEWIEVNGQRVDRPPLNLTDDVTAVCRTVRKGSATANVSSFSVADAKRAALWGKSGPWTNYPLRMLCWRARQFNLNDNFADVLKGFQVVHEEEAATVTITTPTAPPDGRQSMRAPKSEPQPEVQEGEVVTGPPNCDCEFVAVPRRTKSDGKTYWMCGHDPVVCGTKILLTDDEVAEQKAQRATAPEPERVQHAPTPAQATQAVTNAVHEARQQPHEPDAGESDFDGNDEDVAQAQAQHAAAPAVEIPGKPASKKNVRLAAAFAAASAKGLDLSDGARPARIAATREFYQKQYPAGDFGAMNSWNNLNAAHQAVLSAVIEDGSLTW